MANSAAETAVVLLKTNFPSRYTIIVIVEPIIIDGSLATNSVCPNNWKNAAVRR